MADDWSRLHHYGRASDKYNYVFGGHWTFCWRNNWSNDLGAETVDGTAHNNVYAQATRDKMITRLTIIVIGLLTLFSCERRGSILMPENRLSKREKHKDLISFHSHYLREYSEQEFENPDLAEVKITEDRNLDTLNVRVELPFSGCADIDGDFEIRGDSLILSYWLRYEELCTELVYYKMDYKLTDRSNADFKIKLKYLK
jgi:hypothetical protein